MKELKTDLVLRFKPLQKQVMMLGLRHTDRMRTQQTPLFPIMAKVQLLLPFLDLTIVKESECKYNLDDLMQVLYAKYKANPEKGITEQDIFSAANKLAGKDLSSFFNHVVHSTAAIDYPTYFKHAGLEYKSEQDTNKISLA